MNKLQVVSSIICFFVVLSIQVGITFKSELDKNKRLQMQRSLDIQRERQKECALAWPLKGRFYEECIGE